MLNISQNQGAWSHAHQFEKKLAQKLASFLCWGTHAPGLWLEYESDPGRVTQTCSLDAHMDIHGQQGQPVLWPIRLYGAATNRCGWPLGHLVQIQCTVLPLPAVILSGSRPALQFLSKSKSSIAGCWLCVKLGCLFQGLLILEHLGQPLWPSTLPYILACQTTRWAEPMPAGGTACDDLVCSQPSLDCIPVCRNSWGYSQQ